MIKLLVEGSVKSPRASWLFIPQFREEMLALGVELVDSGPCDASLVVDELNHVVPLPSGDWPSIILDVSDPISLRDKIRTALWDPRTKAVLRAYTFRTMGGYSRSTWGVDTHHVLTHRAFVGNTRPCPDVVPGVRIPLSHLERVHLSWPAALMSPAAARRLMLGERLTPPPPLMARPYDVGFIGQLCYTRKHLGDYLLPPDAHRQLMTRQLAKLTDLKVLLKETNSDPEIPRPKLWINNWDFVEMLGQCKISVSPWGWSAWSYRDFDSITAGCVTIKPICHDVAALPDFFTRESKWLYWCRADLADLEEVIRDRLSAIAADPEPFDQRHRIDNPEELLKTCAPKQVAARMASHVQGALAR